MTKVKLTREQLLLQLEEQVRFLRTSAEAYDNGFHAEAKRMAATIRILVHDTRDNNRSLLGQLDLKKIQFYDGGLEIDSRNLIPTTGLTGMKMGPEGIQWVARSLMPPGISTLGFVNFERWWTRPVIMDDEKITISRQQLVLTMADQDGGAHVDPALERTYARLSRQNSIGWTINGPQGSKPFDGVELASVRQVTWELLHSLKERRPFFRSVQSSPRTGRNDLCPCGSGKKFKKCHGASV
jgi:hypothetical protein